MGLIVRAMYASFLLLIYCSVAIDKTFAQAVDSDSGLFDATPSDNMSEFENSAPKEPAPVKMTPTVKSAPSPTPKAPVASPATLQVPIAAPASSTSTSSSMPTSSVIKNEVLVPAQPQQNIAPNIAPSPVVDASAKASPVTVEKTIEKKVEKKPSDIISELPENGVKVAPIIPAPNEFSGAPAMPGGLRVMADGEAPEIYAVQYGDTLFDICDQLLDERAYWPKLWSMNPDIKNPHFIFPGMKLKFFPGDRENPPYLQVLNEIEIVPIDKGEISEKDLVAVKDIVEFEMTKLPALKQFEMVDLEDLPVSEQILENFETMGEFTVRDEETLFVPGFIYAEEQAKLGSIGNGVDGGVLVAPDDQVILEGFEGNVAVGQRYRIVRSGKEVNHPVTGEQIGFIYYYVASVFVEKQFSDEERQIYLGRIQESRLPVEMGDFLLSYGSAVRVISPINAIGLISTTDATVVALSFEHKEIEGAGSYVFIDRGTSHGISMGQFFEVYKKYGQTFANVEQLVPANDRRPIGVIRIIDVTDVGAVGFVVTNERMIEIGDTAGKGSL